METHKLMLVCPCCGEANWIHRDTDKDGNEDDIWECGACKELAYPEDMKADAVLVRPEVKVLEKPLTEKEIRERVDEFGMVEGVVRISIHDIFNADFEQTLDLFSRALVGNDGLTEINYEMVGMEDKDTVLFRVSGFADFVLEGEEELDSPELGDND